jgi:hypothetical protein
MNGCIRIYTLFFCHHQAPQDASPCLPCQFGQTLQDKYLEGEEQKNKIKISNLSNMVIEHQATMSPDLSICETQRK